MSPKTSVSYVCAECGAQHPKWAGRCATCGAWNSLEESLQAKTSGARRVAGLNALPVTEVQAGEVVRLPSGSPEFDRVLGGGFVPGTVVLVGGEPGIGKSTLLLQLSGRVARGQRILYASGEESLEQIGLRANRLGVSEPDLRLVAATDVDRLIKTIDEENPALVIIDSIQTMATDQVQSAPGSLAQVRETAARLQVVAKERGVTAVLVGHVTKEGSIAGPKVLEHLVDVVLYLEGDRFHGHRLLRGVKNRFGPTDEVGVFTMDEDGLQDVADPAAAFTERHDQHPVGTGLTVTLEGTRALLIELQALAVETSFGYPKRTANGFDRGKLELLIAVLSRHAGVKLGSSDIYFNVGGGYRLNDPGSDLAAALTVAAAVRGTALPADTVALGEVGLSGEVRPAQQIRKRLAEAKRAGIKKIITSARGETPKTAGLTVQPVQTVAEAVAVLKGQS